MGFLGYHNYSNKAFIRSLRFLLLPSDECITLLIYISFDLSNIFLVWF
jgi:hypothetical protein